MVGFLIMVCRRLSNSMFATRLFLELKTDVER
jgi:hypothetical protein